MREKQGGPVQKQSNISTTELIPNSDFELSVYTDSRRSPANHVRLEFSISKFKQEGSCAMRLMWIIQKKIREWHYQRQTIGLGYFSPASVVFLLSQRSEISCRIYCSHEKYVWNCTEFCVCVDVCIQIHCKNKKLSLSSPCIGRMQLPLYIRTPFSEELEGLCALCPTLIIKHWGNMFTLFKSKH